VGGDKQLLNELITIFLQEFPAIAKRLKESLLAGDVAALRDPVHRLKGSLGYLGMPHPAGLAEEIEIASRAENPTRVAGLIDALIAHVNLLQPAMRAIRAENSYVPSVS
jgi:HPt (histidine-containing phosphotransfer) domain-containing protein